MQNIQIREGMGRGAPNARVEMGPVGSEDHHGEAGCLPAAHEDFRADLHAAVHGGSQPEAGKSMRRKECGRNCYGQMATPNSLPSLCQLRTVGGRQRARSEVELEKKESVPNWGKVFSVCSSSSPPISIFNWQ